MAKKKQRRADPDPEYGAIFTWVFSILVIALGLILLLGGFGAPFGNALAGEIGNLIFVYVFGIIGLLAYVLPLALITLGVSDRKSVV